MQVKLIDLPDFSTTSGSDGSYTLRRVPTGHHTIMAVSSGEGSGQLDVFVRANETIVQNLLVNTFLQRTPTPFNTLPAQPGQGEMAPPSGTGNWAGSWILNFGTMNLNQSDANISGVYHNAFNQADGTIQGTVSDNVLDGTWSNGNRSGSIHWVLSGDGNDFNGNFNGSSKWCGARPGKPFPAGCSFAGDWTSNVAGNQNCAMKLTRIDMTVTGTYCNGKVSGTISYTGHSNETILKGTWTTTDSGPFQLFMLGYNAVQFQGHWNRENEWCGWRANATMPSPCFH
jgi:hypothetical protein